MTHARALLATDELIVAVEGNLCEPAEIKGSPAAKPFLNPAEPVTAVLVAVVHFLEDPAAQEAVDYLKGMLAPGSYLMISHATADDATAGEAEMVQETYRRARSPITLRTRSAVERFFDDMELAAPGVTGVSSWHSRPGSVSTGDRCLSYAGVARKR